MLCLVTCTILLLLQCGVSSFTLKNRFVQRTTALNSDGFNQNRPNYMELINKAKAAKLQSQQIQVEEEPKPVEVKVEQNSIKKEILTAREMTQFKNKVPFEEDM